MIDVYEFLKKSIKFELIYTDEKGRQTCFDSEIADVLEDKLLIKYPTSVTGDFSTIEPFDKLTAIAYTNDGVLSSNINYLGKTEAEASEIYISFPYNNQFCQRRENGRTPIHIDFELEIINSGNGALIKHSLKTKNISGRGLACMTEEPLPDFEQGRIFLKFKDTQITTFCRKVYSKSLTLNGETFYVNGIAFSNIAKEDIRFIMKKCLHFEISAKHNERLFESI